MRQNILGWSEIRYYLREYVVVRMHFSKCLYSFSTIRRYYFEIIVQKLFTAENHLPLFYDKKNFPNNKPHIITDRLIPKSHQSNVIFFSFQLTIELQDSFPRIVLSLVISFSLWKYISAIETILQFFMLTTIWDILTRVYKMIIIHSLINRSFFFTSRISNTYIFLIECNYLSEEKKFCQSLPLIQQRIISLICFILDENHF